LGITELEFVTSAADAATENGYNLVVWPSEMHDQNKLRRLTQQGLVDGMIVMEVCLKDERIDLLREIDFPFSMIGRCADAEDIGYVDIDFAKTLQDTISYLAELGHKHIAFLNQSQEIFDSGYGPAVRAQAGFEQAMRDTGLEGVTCFCHATPRAGHEAFNDLLSRCPDLTAIVAMNDRAIPGIMQAAADRSWLIPQDLSIVAIISSAHIAEMMMPPLTTADAPTTELGRLGAELLIQQLEEREKSVAHVLLPCHFVSRGSSGPCYRNA
jgi:DNA-binding LacI/PurR family transcriptional regulator